jgi:glycosyltransferase involved in cell wall biosynthesis
MLINLAYLLNRPTGTSQYALNLLPYLQPLNPIYLATPASGLSGDRYSPVAENMTADSGTAGHLRRLAWTQLQLPKLYRQSQSKLLFSPIPEAPLASQCRSVVTFHDLIPLRFPQFFGSIKLFYRYYVPQVLAAAEQIICNSEATARDVTDFYGISARKLVPIPLAYDQNHFRPTEAKPDLPAEVRSRRYFLVLGRQAPYKNIGLAIAALLHLPSDCQLLIAGPTDPRYTPQLQAQVDELGLGDRVKFLSYVPYDQLPALLSHALALLFPSLWEGFGLPVLEAMACGTPVISSNSSSLPEVTGDAALLIEPTNGKAWANAMQRVAQDNTLAQQLSAAGLKRAQGFSWEKTGRATVEVLRRYL